MKISDRDKKIILIVLIAVVVALPYLFLIKPTGEKQTAVENDIVGLQARYDELAAMEEQREFYEKQIVILTDEREAIIEKFAQGIRQENTIMFLRGIELSEENPITMTTISFGGNEVTPILPAITNADGTVSGAIDAIKNQTAVEYTCEYEDMKEFLEFILQSEERDERMVTSAIEIAYDNKTGKLEGVFVLDQFAVTGDGRELAPAVIPEMEHGNESVFGTWIEDEEVRAEREEAETEEEE